MAKIPKHKRMKRPTVLIKRTRCLKNTKPVNKTSFSPLFQKLKLNNNALAKSLSQEKQESQLLFSRNVELLAEVQDLSHACNCRDLVITNVLKNAKELMQMLVTMSGYLTNTISACQEFASSQSIMNRTSSSSSAGRRESAKRMSTKSPARGVVKPMVSGHTITKPTINLSRVNMQRLPNTNLSIIQESSSPPERNLERTSEVRRSRPLPVPRSEVEDEDRVNRRASRYSAGRLSSGRYSKRNSGRLSGGGAVAGRLSRRSSDYPELIKSPRVHLQDVSRYLTNNQTVNVRLLSETETTQRLSCSAVEDTELSDQSGTPSSGESSPNVKIPETQEDSQETSESEQESSPVHSRKQTSLSKIIETSSQNNTTRKTNTSNRRSTLTKSDLIDPMEGSSWMYNDTPMETEEPITLNNGIDSSEDDNDEEGEPERSMQEKSPVSSFSINERRRPSTFFRVPELPKNLARVDISKLNMTDDFISSPTANLRNGIPDDTNMFSDSTDEDDAKRVILNRFVTQRRGPSSRVASSSTNGTNGTNGLEDDYEDDDDDDDTLMINMRRQIRPPLTQHHQTQVEQPERLQFDIDELLQLTPLKPLLKIQRHNGLAEVEVEPEPTVTVQLTSRLPKSTENTEQFCRKSTVKLQRGVFEQPSMIRSQEPTSNGQDKRFSDITTVKLQSRIELPRLTDVLDCTVEDHQRTQMILTPETKQAAELPKRKRLLARPTDNSASEDNEEHTKPKTKKQRGRKKKSQQDKDPSAVKVVLKKLNDEHRNSAQSENGKMTERKNSDESVSSMRSSTVSRADGSDSESSSIIPLRPRRQKAPKNLAEPSLSKKLRR